MCPSINEQWTGSAYQDSNPEKNGGQQRGQRIVVEKKKPSYTGDEHSKSKYKDNLYEVICSELKTTEFALVYLTFVLVLVGVYQLRSADENTKNAERAYLVATPLFGEPRTMPVKGSIEEWRMKVRAKKSMFKEPWRMTFINFGRTPAYTTKVVWGFCPRDNFDTSIPVSTLLDAPEHAEWRMLYLTGETTIQDIFSPNADNPLHYRHIELTDDQMKGYLGWVFFGRVIYKDVFKDEHFTTFSYHLTEHHHNSIGKSFSDDHS